MEYTVYTTSTGEIVLNGFSNVENVNDIAKENTQTVVEGVYQIGQYRFISGVATAIVEQVLDYVRAERDLLLNGCDWTQTADSPLSDSKKSEWVTYRQALRDLPANNSSAGTIEAVTFPTVPS